MIILLIVSILGICYLAYAITFHTGTMYSKDKWKIEEKGNYFIIRGKNWKPLE